MSDNGGRRYRERLPTPPATRKADASLYDRDIHELVGQVMADVAKLSDRFEVVERLEDRFGKLENDVHALMRRVGWVVGALTSGAVVAFELYRTLKP
jgi:hypothetical protein